MARIPEAAKTHYRTMQDLQEEALAAAWRGWAEVRPAALTRSWNEVLPAVTEAISAVQLDAAAAGSLYGATTLAEQGSWIAPEAFVDPQGWAGYSSSGAPLDSALYSPVPAVKDLLVGGATVRQAMEYGRSYLEQLVRTIVADTGRSAASVDVAVRPGAGYVRMLNPPSCERCVVLAGRFYRWNAGFLRHPHCDCVHVISAAGSTAGARAEGLVDDPYEYFRSLSEAEQDATWGPGSAQAIRDGADIFQVTNASRGARGMMTTEGTGRRGHFRSTAEYSRTRGRRLTPDAIYRLNGTDRAAAVRDLERYGYILPGGQNPKGSLVGQREGFGALGRGGTRKAASQAVLDARASGVRDGSRYTMTEAERRLYDAEQRWRMVQEGRNPYASPGFGNTPDPFGQRLNTVGAGDAPLTPEIAAQVETDFRRWLLSGGQVFTPND